MSHLVRPLVRVLAVLAAGLAVLVGAEGAHAASPARDEVFDVPSLKGNVDVKRVSFNDNTTSLQAWVRLPQGYDDDPGRRWPVLYLLHGWEDSATGWLEAKKGNLDGVLPADFPGIVVMPEGGKEWFVNWYGSYAGNPGHKWQDYLLEEVLPFMEDHLRILPGRANHAIGGLSMGGFGGLHAVQTLPTYFGQALSFSSLIDTDDTTFGQILNIASASGFRPGYGSIFGPTYGPYANSMNPLRNPRDFKGSRLSLYYGTPAISTLWSLDIRARGTATLEVGANLQAQQFYTALRGQGADVFQLNTNNGSHDWPWWKRYLANAYTRGIWNAPPITETSQATSWQYDTMQTHGNAWGIGFKFAAFPSQKVTFIREGQLLVGRGGSGIVRIAGGAADDDASGNGTRADCTWTLRIPFAQVLPAGC